MKKIFSLLAWILFCSLAGVFAAQFEPGTWYQMLEKPSWTPPNWLFPIVWPILYIMMGTSAWLVWKMESVSLADYEFKWFFIQLGLNAIWSWLFFGKQYISTGLAEILLLWVAIAFTILLFWNKNKAAALLLIPYLLWISYASALNYAIWKLN